LNTVNSQPILIVGNADSATRKNDKLLFRRNYYFKPGFSVPFLQKVF